MTDVVLFEEIQTEQGKIIGSATLNSEKTLNALSLEMIQQLHPKLLGWQEDPNVVMVLLQGSGEKAFCAGGDVVSLYQEMKTHEGAYSEKIETFFTHEYQLDYLIHAYEKPILLLGHGIVMGGGLGLMAGASHRVVTERSRIAMPEITIGLYPDVGGSWFLNKMPTGCGLFLGLTGAPLNASDAKSLKLADFFVPISEKANLVESLKTLNWGDTIALNHQKLSDRLREIEQNNLRQLPRGNLSPHMNMIESITTYDRLAEVVDAILSYQTEDEWFLGAQKTLQHGSPISAHILYRQMEFGATKTLADCFRMELGLSVNCGKFGEFAEGVRALLVDKDRNPTWTYRTVNDVDPKVIDEFFVSPWDESSHPLKKLGIREEN